MAGNLKRKKKKSEIKKDLYRQVKRAEKKEKKEYESFCERLTEAVSLSGDVAGELILYMAGRHCMVIRNFLSVTEYTSERICLKTKQYEVCIGGICLHIEYFLPEEIRVTGEISSVTYYKARG